MRRFIIGSLSAVVIGGGLVGGVSYVLSTKPAENLQTVKRVEKVVSKQSTTNSSSETDSVSIKPNQTYDDVSFWARVWLTKIPNTGWLDVSDANLERKILVAGSPVNPYGPDHSAKYPTDVELILGNYGDMGNVTFKNNFDGTVTYYDVPSHFQEPWNEPAYSEQESQRIIDTATTVKIADFPADVTNKVVSRFR